MNIGFTGTRYGMTEAQRAKVRELVGQIAKFDNIVGHHGDCVGADAQFHEIIREFGGKLIVYPPVDENHRAFCKSADEWRMPMSHFARNRAICMSADCLIGTPFDSVRKDRGGTWYTISYAEKKGIPVSIVFPQPDETTLLEQTGRPWPISKISKITLL